MVSTSTFAASSAATISRVASMPFSSGMRMSMSTTSGASSRTFATASRPLTAAPAVRVLTTRDTQVHMRSPSDKLRANAQK